MSSELPRSGVFRDGQHLYPVRIYYEDTDAAGLVYYVNYFKYAERARTEMLRNLGFEQERLRTESGLIFVVRHATADYRLAGRLDDDLTVATRMTGSGAATLDLAQEIRRQEAILVALEFQIACVGSGGRPQRLPAELRAALDSVSSSATAAAHRSSSIQPSGVNPQHAR